MIHFPVKTAVAAAALAVVPHLALATEPGQIVQLPHRAVYSMALANSSGIGGPGQIRGVMLYEVVETCEAWKIDTKVLIRTAEGDDEAETLRKLYTWEAKDGQGFRFRVEETQGGKAVQALKGVAVLDGMGGPGVADYSAPRAAKVALPKGTHFPSAHMAAMIARSIDGAAHFATVVFDGSSPDDPFLVSAVIGPAGESKLPSDVTAAIGLRPRWESRLAYFPLAKRAETPDFELTVTYRDDGIVETLRQDYDNHAIDSRLRQIELLERPACPAPGTAPTPEGTRP